ncbi:MAG: alpha/beta fold hydrolase [Mucilaginibacter sp.]|uniref:alpha/beta fold hydrolase n=1 Tax=Mucilaginibacter sp. TaxID=1882438 RepID=UPI0034E59707
MKKEILLFVSIAFTSCLTCCNNASNNNTQSNKLNIQNQGVKIAYTDQGNGDTTLLFVHGWCINKTYWTNQVAYFNRKYRVVTMDLPGFGQSGKNRKIWNTATFAKDVDAVIAQLHLKNVILIGHSMAGDIIVQAAINAPQKVVGLVGVDNFKSVGIGSKPTKQDSLAYAKAIDSLKHNFKAIAFEYFNHDLFYKTTSSAIRKRVLNDVAHSDSTIAAACMELSNFDEANKLVEANKKLCLINSDVKPTNTSGLKAKKIPFQVWFIHATGHFPMIEKPDGFNVLLQKAIYHIKS